MLSVIVQNLPDLIRWVLLLLPWTLWAGTWSNVSCLLSTVVCLRLHTRQPNCKMGTFSARRFSARLDATQYRTCTHRLTEAGSWTATMVISHFPGSRAKRDEGKMKKQNGRRQSDTRLTRLPMVAQGTADRFCRGSMWLWNPQSSGSTSSSHVRLRLSPHQGHCGRHATVSSHRSLGIVWRRELLSNKQEMRLIRARRGRAHG